MTAQLDINEAFASALAADADLAGAGAEAAPPPRKPDVVDADAPHGRADDGTPYAPYGLNKKTGKPNKTPGGPGRPPANPDARPRTTTTASRPSAPPATPQVTVARDYSSDLVDLADGLWMVMSGLPAPGKIRVRIQAQAGLLAANKTALVRAGTIAAQHHEGTAQLIAKVTTGSGAWMLPCMFALGPFVAQSVTLWRSPAEDLKELAAANEAEFRRVLGAAELEAAAMAASMDAVGADG